MSNNFFLIVCLSILSIVYTAERYSKKYDQVDLDSVLNNERLYRQYLNCFLEQGKCTPEGQQVRDRIEDSLKTSCAKCTERQRKGAERVLRYLMTSRPNDFKKLENKYDPNGVYRRKFEAPAYL